VLSEDPSRGRAEAAAATAKPGLLLPVDRLLLCALAALTALALVAHPRPLPFVLGLALLAAFLLASAVAAPRHPALGAVHHFAPAPLLVVIFSVCGPLIEAATTARHDLLMASLDARLFGPLAPGWRGALGRPRWLTDTAYLAYVSYYVVPIAMGVALYSSGRRREFEAFSFAVVAVALLSYAGYFLVPVTGPRVPPQLEDAVLGGGLVSSAVRLFLRSAEKNTLDAFPSGHTALSLVFLGHGWQLFPRWRAPIVIVVAGIVFSTVYLSLHYVVDLVAGAALALLMPSILPFLRRLFGGPEQVPPRVAGRDSSPSGP